MLIISQIHQCNSLLKEKIIPICCFIMNLFFLIIYNRNNQYYEILNGASLHVIVSLRDFYNQCILCKFTPKNRKYISNSSKKDAILSFGLNNLYNLFPLIRSLRTTGSKCRFILLTNSKSLTMYSSAYYKSANLCGVEFINISFVSYSKKETYFLRYFHLKNFLIKN